MSEKCDIQSIFQKLALYLGSLNYKKWPTKQGTHLKKN